MPNATISDEAVRKELKSLPEGFVMLRQLPFGRILTRRDKASRFLQQMNPNSKPGDITQLQIDILNEASRQYDFANCIVDHNLEDRFGNKLDFGNPMTLDILDPKVGQEIERYIDELNQEELDEEGFTLPSDRSSNPTSPTSPNGEE